MNGRTIGNNRFNWPERSARAEDSAVGVVGLNRGPQSGASIGGCGLVAGQRKARKSPSGPRDRYWDGLIARRKLLVRRFGRRDKAVTPGGGNNPSERRTARAAEPPVGSSCRTRSSHDPPLQPADQLLGPALLRRGALARWDPQSAGTRASAFSRSRSASTRCTCW